MIEWSAGANDDGDVYVFAHMRHLGQIHSYTYLVPKWRVPHYVNDVEHFEHLILLMKERLLSQVW